MRVDARLDTKIDGLEAAMLRVAVAIMRRRASSGEAPVAGLAPEIGHGIGYGESRNGAPKGRKRAANAL